MAVDADPQSSRRIVLAKHRDRPEAEQPAFLVRRLRRRESKRLAPILKRLDALTKTSSLDEAENLFDEVEAFVQRALVGWENQTGPQGKPVAFDPSNLDICIDEAELFELAVLVRSEHLGAGEKKVSASPSESNSGPAAATVRPESAATDPAPETPSSSGAPNAREPEGSGDLAETPAPTAGDGES